MVGDEVVIETCVEILLEKGSGYATFRLPKAKYKGSANQGTNRMLKTQAIAAEGWRR